MSETTDVGNPRTCPDCGAVAQRQAAFCGSCGRPLEGKFGRKSRRPVWAASAVVLIAAVGAHLGLLGVVALSAYSRAQGDSREVAATKKLEDASPRSAQPSESSDSAQTISAPPRPTPSPVDTTAPPYAPVPIFTTRQARDAAFLGAMAGLTSWQGFPSGTFGFMQRPSASGPAAEWKAAVLAEAQEVCTSLTNGVSANSLPTLGIVLDEVDQSALLVDSVMFYCPEHLGKVTKGAYTKPVPQPQKEDCPGAEAVRIDAGLAPPPFEGYTAVRASVTNTSRYDVRVALQERLTGAGTREWSAFGVALDYAVVDIKAGDTFEHEDGGVFAPKYTYYEVRLKPGEYVFIDCGYQAGFR